MEIDAALCPAGAASVANGITTAFMYEYFQLRYVAGSIPCDTEVWPTAKVRQCQLCGVPEISGGFRGLMLSLFNMQSAAVCMYRL